MTKIAILIAALLVQAQEPKPALLCDSPEQIERIINLAATEPVQAAVATTNEEAQKPNACGALLVVLNEGEEVKRVRGASGSYRIVEVMVVAVFVPQQGLRPVQPFWQFTLLPIRELPA
jgi:hypothetical protein